MKTPLLLKRTATVIALVVTMLTAGTARAQGVTCTGEIKNVAWVGINPDHTPPNPYNWGFYPLPVLVDPTGDGTHEKYQYDYNAANEITFKVEGEEEQTTGYCFDFLNPAQDQGVDQLSCVTALPLDNDDNCLIAELLANYSAAAGKSLVDGVEFTAGDWGATIQWILWKLFTYDTPAQIILNSALAFFGATYDDFKANADALVAALQTKVNWSTGRCLPGPNASVKVDIEESGGFEGGTFDVSVSLSSGKMPLIGQTVMVSSDKGTFEASTATTDENGQARFVLKLGDAEPPVTVTAHVEASLVQVMDPVEATANVLQTFIRRLPQVLEATGKFVPVNDIANFFTIGYWKAQVRYCLKGKGRGKVPCDLLEGWLPIKLFDLEELTYSTLSEVYDQLWINNRKAPMQERAEQQCLATHFNALWADGSGKSYGYYTPVDVTGDGIFDGYLGSYLDQAKTYYLAGAYEQAKNICDALNNEGGDGTSLK